jgi:predicted MFS family arabinose efflux permease
LIQLSIILGATLGGFVFDAFGPKIEFLGGDAFLLIAALLAFASSRGIRLW